MATKQKVEISAELGALMGNRVKEFVKFFLGLFRPPPNEPIHVWAEKNVELSAATSKIGGRIRFDLFPVSIFFFQCFQNPLTRRILRMSARQCSKTEDAITALLWSVVNKPRPCMWAMALDHMIEDFAKDRLYPAFQNCKVAFDLAPKERKHWTKKFLKLLSMTLYLRGSKSRAKLQSTPVGLLMCDERKDWQRGSINIIRNTMTTYGDGLEVSMGVAGDNGDEWHNDWKEGSQTFMHFNCLKCQHSQPWRFSKKPSTIFPDERTKGGIVWPSNEITKPNGKWNFDEVEKQARFECEDCGHLHGNEDKMAMLKSATFHHRNPDAFPRTVSIYQNQLSAPWETCDFGKIAVRFLKAIDSMKRGDVEPLKNFTAEVLCEPWEMPESRKGRDDILKTVGDYKMGEFWKDPANPTALEPGTYYLMTLDRQLHYIRYVIRQWRKKTGDSRLVDCGKVPSIDDARAKQHEWKIFDTNVWGDDGGGHVSDFRMKALVWGWGILKGEDASNFAIYRRENGVDKSHRQGWRETALDPGIGTTHEGRATKKAFLWSNPWFKERLYFLFIPKNGPIWEIPSDVPADYIAELSANEWREKENKSDGSIEGFWYESGADHAADCELEQLVVADIGGFTRALAK